MTVTANVTSVTDPLRGPGQGLGPGQADQDPDQEEDIDMMYFFNVNGLVIVMDGMYIIAIKADQGSNHQLSKGTKVCTLSIETFIQIFLNT